MPTSLRDQAEPRVARAVTTAVILARGLGTRMRAAGRALDQAAAAVADSGVKALMPIRRPFLDYVLHELAEAGVREVVVVVGPEHHALRSYYADLPLSRLSVSFAIQDQPRGTADAVASAAEVVGNGRFLVINGDNHYPAAALRALAVIPDAGLVGFSRQGLTRGNIPSERLRRFAIAVDDGSGHLADLVEKPDAAHLARLGDASISMNCWCFGPTIFSACRAVVASARGELELPDAVRLEIANGARFRIVPAETPVLDLSCRDDLASVRAALCEREVML